MPHISYSEIKDLLRCRQKWYYGWWEEIKPRERPFVMDVGDLGHRCLEYYYKGLEWEKALQVAQEELEVSGAAEDYETEGFHEAVETVRGIIPNYIAYAEEHDSEFIRKVLTVEQRGEVLIPGFQRTYLGYKWDLLVQAPDGGVYLWEHKFIKQAQTYEYLEFDLQTHTYLWAAATQQLNVRGVVFNLVRHKPTQADPDIWVLRERTYRTPEQLESIGVEVGRVARERNNLRKMLKGTLEGPEIYRNMMMGCRDCVYRNVCLGEHKGIDMSILKHEQFQTKED